MQNKKKPTIKPKTIKSAIIKQRESLSHPSGKKQVIIIKIMITTKILMVFVIALQLKKLNQMITY